MTRGIWDRETVALMLLVAWLPLVVVWIGAEGIDAIARLAFFLIVAGMWHVIWMLGRAQPPSFAGVLTAISVAILGPEDLGLVALLLGISFGVVSAELAFGGWGRNVVNAATITLAFWGFGFPAAPWPDLAVQFGWAVYPAALIGVATGVMSLRIFLGAALALGAAHLLGVDMSEPFTAILVVLLLLVCDPVANASTALGRWLAGAFYGGMIVLFVQVWTHAAPVQLAVSAALLTSLAAPLFDEIAIALWIFWRNRRFG